MKTSLTLLKFLLAAFFVVACGQDKIEETAQVLEQGFGAVKNQSGRALTSATATRNRMLRRLPQLTARGQALGADIPRQLCPSGLSQVCLDELFMAFNNSPFIKSIATYSQASIGALQNGSMGTLYVAQATQPSVNAGFTLHRSTFNQSQFQLPVPLSGAFGQVFLSNLQPQAAIGLFVTVTDHNSIVGIAGGLAGADRSGWVEAAFYCYLENTSGQPRGNCAVVPVTTGGW